VNNSEFVDRVSEEPLFSTRKEAREAVETVFDTLDRVLRSGQSVMITDFGKFSVVGRNERSGVNPRTGEKIHISAKKAVTFKAAKVLKENVNA